MADGIPGVGGLLAPSSRVEQSDVPVTIVMPLHPKDLWIAPWSLEASGCGCCFLQVDRASTFELFRHRELRISDGRFNP
jgi:hypothetical protein